MRNLIIALVIILFGFLFSACASNVASQPPQVSGVTSDPETPIKETLSNTEETPSESKLPTEPSPTDKEITGSFYRGIGPSTFPIVKELGPVLLHLKVESCNASIILSKKGQNIPYMSSKVVSSDQFEDQFQFFNEFQGVPNREETVILDNPTPYEDYGAPPQTEELRIQEVSEDCRWEITLQPVSTARTLSPGETIVGSYSDVILPANGLTGTKLLFMHPDYPMMLQHFGGIFSVFEDGHAIDLMPEDSDYYEFSTIPDGTIYLELFADDYWEIEGK